MRFAASACQSRGFSISLDFPSRSRRCGKSGCMGYKNTTECEVIVQTERCLRSGGKAVEEIDQLPRKELTKGGLTVESLERIVQHVYALRKLTPKNGRAVMVFRDKCGCAYAKLERRWGEMSLEEVKRLLARVEERSHEEKKWRADDCIIAMAENLAEIFDLLEEEKRQGNDHLLKAVEKALESF
ncbi:hypothetical protein ACET3Z_032509 [Daucus carota]